MAKTVSDVVDFEHTSPKELYSIMTDAKKISDITGFDTDISKKEGDNFIALNGGVKGTNLYIVPDKLIVQAWRRITWRKDWLDAIVIISFSERENGGARIDLINANLPETEVQFMDWNTYWNPIKAYLMQQRKVKV